MFCIDERSTSTGRSLDISTSEVPTTRGRTPLSPKNSKQSSHKSSTPIEKNKDENSPIETVQNAIRSHEIREQSLERVKKSETVTSQKPPQPSKRTVWSSDQRNALRALQNSIASHNVRSEFLSSKESSNQKVTDVQIAIKSHQLRQETLHAN